MQKGELSASIESDPIPNSYEPNQDLAKTLEQLESSNPNLASAITALSPEGRTAIEQELNRTSALWNGFNYIPEDQVSRSIELLSEISHEIDPAARAALAKEIVTIIDN